MRLGKLFRAAVGVAMIPSDLAADMLTLGMRKATDGETFTGKKVREIEEALDEVTD